MEGTITIAAAPDPTPPPPPPPPDPGPPPPPDPTPPEPTDDGGTPTATPAQTSLSLANVKLVGAGSRPPRLRATATCDGSNGPCKLTLLVKARVAKRLLAGVPKGKKTITLSKKRFTVRAGSTRTIKAALSKPGRKVFKRSKRLRRVTVVLRGRDDAGAIPKLTQRVKLTVPPAKS